MPAAPNIVLILADDMGYGDFAGFNFGASSTPALDHLQSEALCLSQHYSGSPVCAPARAALLSGRYPHRTGAIDTFEALGSDRLGLGEVTLADLLGQQGCVTGLIGKWHNGALDDRYHPNKRGFDEFVGFRGGWHDYWNWRIERNGATQIADGRYLTEVFTEEALSFVRRHRRERFFLHLAYNAPHFPLQAPPQAVAPFVSRECFSPAVSAIYGMLAVMDQGIGRLLEELETLGLQENTLVMFSSDNGPDMGGEGEMSKARFNCGFNGAKGVVYEGGIRVPMLLRWPAGMRGPGTCNEMVHFVDWLPTLVHLGDPAWEPGRSVDGVDVSAVLHGDVPQERPNRFWQWNRYEPVGTCNAAMREGDWKLVRPAIREAMMVHPEDAALDRELKEHPDRITTARERSLSERLLPAPAPSQLFNIAADPLERVDLRSVEPTRAKRMEDELKAWFEEVEYERHRSARETGPTTR